MDQRRDAHGSANDHIDGNVNDDSGDDGDDEENDENDVATTTTPKPFMDNKLTQMQEQNPQDDHHQSFPWFAWYGPYPDQATLRSLGYGNKNLSSTLFLRGKA